MASLNDIIVESLLSGSDVSNISCQTAGFVDAESTSFLGPRVGRYPTLEVFSYGFSKLIPLVLRFSRQSYSTKCSIALPLI